jgi:hypothetical protein
MLPCLYDDDVAFHRMIDHVLEIALSRRDEDPFG